RQRFRSYERACGAKTNVRAGGSWWRRSPSKQARCHRRRAWRRRSRWLVKVTIAPVDRPTPQEYLYSAGYVADHMQPGCLQEISIDIIEKAMALEIFVVSSHGIKDRLLGLRPLAHLRFPAQPLPQSSGPPLGG